MIAVSVDDTEVGNLCRVLDEVFGEEQFQAQVVVQSNKRGQTYKQKWGIHLTQVAPRRCGLVDPWTPAHCTQNAPWGARRRSAGNWATRLRFGPIKDYARAMAIAGLETWCYRQAFPGAANGQPQYVVVT